MLLPGPVGKGSDKAEAVVVCVSRPLATLQLRHLPRSRAPYNCSVEVGTTTRAEQGTSRQG
jgi:hypothetical protein